MSTSPDHLPPALYAFHRLKENFQAMQQAPDAAALARHWGDYLIAHQRVWNKAEAEFRSAPFWPALRAPFKKRRESEPLLIYLHQARHADEHGIAPIAVRGDGNFRVSGPGKFYGGGVLPDGTVSLAPGTTAHVTFSPNTVLATGVVNRGVRYEPPALQPHHVGPPVLALAELGLQMYEDLFSAIAAAQGGGAS